MGVRSGRENQPGATDDASSSRGRGDGRNLAAPGLDTCREKFWLRVGEGSCEGPKLGSNPKPPVSPAERETGGSSLLSG